MAPQGLPFAGLTRESLHDYRPQRIRAGGGTRPQLLLLEQAGKRAVMKDYRASGWLLRPLIGPWLIGREEHIYRTLAGAPGVPHLIGRLDRHALVVEHVEGRNCAKYADGELPREFFDRLRTVVETLHSRGVVHCDIKNRSNIVVADGDQPYIVDFASAFTRAGSPGLASCLAPLRRLAFDRFRTDDLRAVAKAKFFLARPTANRPAWSEADAEFAFRRDPFERLVRALRDAARWMFKLFAGP